MDTSIWRFNKPLFDVTFVNIDYYFYKVLLFFRWIGGAHHAGSVVYLISYIISLFGITIIFFCIVRLVEIQIDEHRHLRHAIEETMARHAEQDATGKNERWDRIYQLMISPNESDWRLGIIEADTVLEGLLEARGIPGENIGARLKAITPGDLGSLQAAWEAHLVRNRIAHEGTNFELTERDARRTMQLYEVVFRELGFLV
jgi:hypothetical protein